VSTRTWHLRPRPERLGKHRALPTITETDMPPQPAASLPLPEYRTAGELQQRALEPAFDPPADPSNPVQCVRCNAVDLVSNMRYDGRDWRCRDTSACTDRWYADGTYDPKPVSLVPHDTEALEPLPVLPPGQEQALAAFNEAHDEHDADARSEEEEPPVLPALQPSGDTTGVTDTANLQAILDAAPAVAAEPEPQDGGEAE
jgi:hypothetical protein